MPGRAAEAQCDAAGAASQLAIMPRNAKRARGWLAAHPQRPAAEAWGNKRDKGAAESTTGNGQFLTC